MFHRRGGKVGVSRRMQMRKLDAPIDSSDVGIVKIVHKRLKSIWGRTTKIQSSRKQRHPRAVRPKRLAYH